MLLGHHAAEGKMFGCFPSSLMSQWPRPVSRNVSKLALLSEKALGEMQTLAQGSPEVSGVWSVKGLWMRPKVTLISSIFKSELLGHRSLRVIWSLINPFCPHPVFDLTQNTHQEVSLLLNSCEW